MFEINLSTNIHAQVWSLDAFSPETNLWVKSNIDTFIHKIHCCQLVVFDLRVVRIVVCSTRKSNTKITTNHNNARRTKHF